MAIVAIMIPEDPTEHDISLARDVVTFTFTEDTDNFHATPASAFDPHVGSGSFTADTTIGPYTPNKKTTVRYHYHGESLGMHSIVIGD
jgi:hypothetical protein